MSGPAQLVKFIETYRGRDKVIRLCSYAAMFLGGESNSPFAVKARVIARELSSCRVMLRLFDDFPMLLYNLKYGLGKKDKVTCYRLCELGCNLVNQLYYPVEHIAWLADKQILSIKSGSFWVAGVALWAVSLALEVIKCLIKLLKLKRSIAKKKKQKYLDKQDQFYENSEQKEELKVQINSINADIFGQYLLLVQSMADLLNAVNWMPKGFLWSGRISPAKSGLLGFLSTTIMLYRQWLPRG